MKSGIDANTKAVGRGMVQGTMDNIIPFSCTSDNKLLIEIIPVSDPLSNLVASRIHIDANTHQIGAGVTNDSNQTITPLTVDTIVTLPCLRIELI